MRQEHEKYTDEDHEVWQILYDRQVKNLQDKAAPEYLKCVQNIRPKLSRDGVPDFANVDQKLAQTGWQIEVVKGLIPVEDFFPLLAEGRFCSSTWLRSKSQLDYLEEPDMFHDTFGHLPLLLDPVYAAFVKRFGALGAAHSHDGRVVTALQRLYWFTIEFGLMKGKDRPLIYGAGVLSSFGESNHIFESDIEVIPYDVEKVINNHFINSEIQMRYYEIESFKQLFDSLDTVEDLIANGLNIEENIVR
jgi:phenylalanine-4-hydroxylase